MESAHLNATNPSLPMYDADGNVIANGVTLHVRWTGVGLIHRTTVVSDGVLLYKAEWRHATLTGSFTVNGVDSLPGDDFGLGKGRLVREQSYR